MLNIVWRCDINFRGCGEITSIGDRTELLDCFVTTNGNRLVYWVYTETGFVVRFKSSGFVVKKQLWHKRALRLSYVRGIYDSFQVGSLLQRWILFLRQERWLSFSFCETGHMELKNSKVVDRLHIFLGWWLLCFLGLFHRHEHRVRTSSVCVSQYQRWFRELGRSG